MATRTQQGTHRKVDAGVRRWLDSPAFENPTEGAGWAGPEDGVREAEKQARFGRWLLRRMSTDGIWLVQGVLVDAALADQRFGCVPARCAPGAGRGRFRSCCADLDLEVTPAEIARLSRHRRVIEARLRSREPRLLRRWGRGPWPATFFLDRETDVLSKPGRRCVFSELRPDGRIRCHLHPIHRKLELDRADLQPIACRLFPFVLVRMPGRRVLVTCLRPENHRIWGGAHHPGRFPCLSDPTLPPLLATMGPTLDWIFGVGFAAALRRRAAERR